MKTKDKKELHGKTITELQKMLIDAKNSLKNIMFEHAQRKLKNTRSIFNLRQKIAIIQSIQKAKELTKNV